MMQRTGAGPLTRQVLVVDSGLAEPSSAATQRARARERSCEPAASKSSKPLSCEDGLATAGSDAGIHCILLNWTQGEQRQQAFTNRPPSCCARCAQRNAKVPIFLMASRKLAGTVSVEVATLADEFIWILDDTASFIAAASQAAIERYLEALLPPYAAALARYDREREYSWAAPGHQGGVAFLKSPVGRVFFDFYGENLFRTDMGIERGALGSLLGPQRPGRRERAQHRAHLRRAPLVLGAERHLRVQPRDHVGLRRRQRNRALRSQLSQVHRAGPGDHAAAFRCS